MLNRQNAGEESMQGIILLNLYSDDGLASTDNSTIWDKFMLDEENLMPNEENLRVAQKILKYAIGSLDEKITHRPTDANDPFGGYNYGLMAFTDSD
jgi:hypothetical protein